jgi:hypothetical protein
MSIWSSLFGQQEIKPAVGGQMISTTELPAELKPYYKDILSKAQALYNDRTSEGYTPYDGPTLAQFTPEQQQVQSGIAGLVGTQAPVYQEAMGMTRDAATPFTTEQVEEYMSPYQQAVTDIEKREATKQYQSNVVPELAAKAAQNQAFGGSRQAILEGMAADTQQRLLGDIQAKGSAQGYTDAINRLESDRLAKGQGASQLANLGSGQYRAASTELSNLQLVGDEKQRRDQTALDETFKQYLEEKQYPYDTMGKYQSMVIGAPLGTTSYSAPQAAVMGPSLGQQLIGGLGGLGNLYGSFTGRTVGGQPYVQQGSPVTNKHGGSVGAKIGGGLSTLIKRANGDQVEDIKIQGNYNLPIKQPVPQGFQYDRGFSANQNLIRGTENYFAEIANSKRNVDEANKLRKNLIDEKQSEVDATKSNAQFNREQALFSAMANSAFAPEVTNAPGQAGQILTMLSKIGPQVGAAESKQRALVKEQQDAITPLKIKYQEAMATGNLALAEAVMTQLNSLNTSEAQRITALSSGAVSKLSSTLKPKAVQELAATIVGDLMVVTNDGTYKPEGKLTPQANQLSKAFRDAEQQMQNSSSAKIRHKGKVYTINMTDLGAEEGTTFKQMINETGMEALQGSLMRHIADITGLAANNDIVDNQQNDLDLEKDLDPASTEKKIKGDFLKTQKKSR